MISLAQKIIAMVLAVLGGIACFLLIQYPIWWAVLAILVSWCLIAFFAWRILYKWEVVSVEVGILTMSFLLGISGLLFVIESSALRWFLLVLCVAMIYLLYSWQIKEDGYTTHTEKTYRRILMMLWVLTAYLWVTTFYALNIFFDTIGFWVFSLGIGFVMAGISFALWRLYVPLQGKKKWFWMGTMALLCIELAWIFQLLPLGFTVTGFLCTWVWYILQLLFRFHFGTNGVDWKKQRTFLIGNCCLFVLMLVIARWI